MKRALLTLSLALTACSSVIIDPDDTGETNETDPPEGGSDPGGTEARSLVMDSPIFAPREVVIRPDGTIAVVGLVLEGDVPALGVESYDTSGNPLWNDQRATSALGHGLYDVRAATLTDDGSLAVLSQVNRGDGVAGSWLVFYDAAGVVTSEAEVADIAGADVAAASPDIGAGVILAGEDDGTHGSAAQRLAALVHVKPDGTTGMDLREGTRSADAAMASTVVRHPNGGFVVLKSDLDAGGTIQSSEIRIIGGDGPIDAHLGPAGGPLLAVGPDGAIYTASGGQADAHLLICKHDLEGGGWTIDDVRSDTTLLGAMSLAVSEDGDVLVGGFAYPTDTAVSAEMFVRAYASDGTFAWDDAYRGPDGSFAFGMALDTKGDQAVHAGIVAGNDDQPYFTVLRFLDLAAL
ncbi:MAG: hypothetical protein HOW73_01590 [Polyangiaceae bacterium]|nr:hypothetical protein [Polyangiaceae bacterium]